MIHVLVPSIKNMLNFLKLSQSKSRVFNDHQKTDQRNPEAPTIRSVWNTLSRSMLTDLGVPDAQNFNVGTVGLVDEAARRYHNDQKGPTPSVLVVVLKTDDEYRSCSLL